MSVSAGQVCLYASSRGHGSWTRVGAGMRRGLEQIGQLAGFVCTDDLGHQLSDALSVGCDARVGVHVGPPAISGVMRGRGMHAERLALVAANSTWLPRGVLSSLEHESVVTGYVSISPWNSWVLATHTDLPVRMCRCGVSEDFRPNGKTKPDGFKVLHMASTHNERKGTAQLIEAWAEALRRGALPPGATLKLVCDGPRGFFDTAIHQATRGSIELADSYLVRPRLELSENEASDFYQQHHLVCQPSRAEGFGMIPLEARASGVPVVMTDNTGHQCQLDSRWMRRPPGSVGFHLADGVVVVSTDEQMAPIDDGPGARAPTFQTDRLTAALGLAFGERERLSDNALESADWVRENWSWARQCEAFVESLTAGPPRPWS